LKSFDTILKETVPVKLPTSHFFPFYELRISAHFKSVKVFHVRSIELPFTLHLIKTSTVTSYSKAA